MSEGTMLWRRLDTPGHEAARLRKTDGGWRLEGTAVFADVAGPCRLSYAIRLDQGWRTVAAEVVGAIGERDVALTLAVNGDGRWQVNGADVPEIAGCVDLDLNFSPSTNLLPIRRLELAEGAEQPVRAAWLRFPSLRFEPLAQTYRRTGPATYRYESADGAFVSDLTVDPAGFVTDYPGLWRREGA